MKKTDIPGEKYDFPGDKYPKELKLNSVFMSTKSRHSRHLKQAIGAKGRNLMPQQMYQREHLHEDH